MNYKILLLTIFIWTKLLVFGASDVISYEVSPGRFGDNLLTYLHAKWFAYHHHLPLIYRPFPHSSSLLLDEKEIHYKNKPLRRKLGLKPLFKTSIKKWPFLSKLPLAAFNYKCHYFPESQWECKHLKYSGFSVDWEDQNFRKIVKELITPKEKLNLVKPPEGCISIALHVREGGGFDTDEAKRIIPLKLPPLAFYIEGFKRIVSLLPEKAIYCHLFTDALEPEKIIRELQKHIPPNVSVQFGYRQKNNHHDSNVLEDFFSFFHFDILIRSQSNYSLIPSLIHDYAIVYYPTDCKIENGTITITVIEMKLNEILYKNL